LEPYAYCNLHKDCFFFQAEDGIRTRNVTGVQTCALPIWSVWNCSSLLGSASYYSRSFLVVINWKWRSLFYHFGWRLENDSLHGFIIASWFADITEFIIRSIQCRWIK